MIGGKAYRNCPWIGEGSINDSMCNGCGSVLLPKNNYGYARTRAGLFNTKTVNNLLSGSQFNREPKNPNINYSFIGLQFMNELAKVKNFTLPFISQTKYEAIGKIVNKYQLNENTGNTNRKDLTDLINGALNSSMLPNTGNILNPNKDEIARRNTVNEVKNDNQRSENIIKGLLGSNEYYKTSASGLTERESDNRLGGSKTLYNGYYHRENDLNDFKGASGFTGMENNSGAESQHTGYTSKYRPQDPRKGVKAYDSIWDLFKH